MYVCVCVCVWMGGGGGKERNFQKVRVNGVTLLCMTLLSMTLFVFNRQRVKSWNAFGKKKNLLGKISSAPLKPQQRIHLPG